jgi:hypothetical protein
MLKDKITELRNKIRKERAEKASKDKKPKKLPSQYPNMKAKETMLNLVSSVTDLGMNDMDDDTDDDVLTTSAFMARTVIAMEPPGELGTQQPANGQQSTSVECEDTEEVIEVKAHFEYSLRPEYQDKTYAISDGGADSCILGKYAKIISYTGRYASLIGYDPRMTRKEKVPIVSAYIKAKSSSIGNHPVLLKVNEAPYNPQSPITLLSEYQIREHGLIIDSVAKKHKSAHDKFGTQCFQLGNWVYIDFEDRGD